VPNKSLPKGAPPVKLTGQMPVSSLESDHWDRIMSEITGPGGLVGRTLTIEELAGLIPTYPGGRRARGRTIARRMRPVLELIERGPNGSRGRGATYRVIARAEAVPAGSPDIEDQEISTDDDWLLRSVAKMTGETK
jgi:hypothetical protein